MLSFTGVQWKHLSLCGCFQTPFNHLLLAKGTRGLGLDLRSGLVLHRSLVPAECKQNSK